MAVGLLCGGSDGTLASSQLPEVDNGSDSGPKLFRESGSGPQEPDVIRNVGVFFSFRTNNRKPRPALQLKCLEAFFALLCFKEMRDK